MNTVEQHPPAPMILEAGRTDRQVLARYLADRGGGADRLRHQPHDSGRADDLVRRRSGLPDPDVAGLRDAHPDGLASGEFFFDLQTTMTNVSVDHRVDSALHFVVDSCSPDGIPYDFKQCQGFGSQAMPLAAPIEFKPLPDGRGQ